MDSTEFARTRTPSPALQTERDQARRPPRELPPLVPPSSSASLKPQYAGKDALGSHTTVVPTPYDESSTLIKKLNKDHAVASRLGGESEGASANGETPRGGLF